MISNKKIKRIRKMPEGNNIILIWVFLLAEAGESNKGGALFLTDAIPFTVEDLAIEFDFEPDIIKLALITLQKYQMIQIFDDVIYIKNWEEYQNVEGLDKIREQTRKRVAKYRQNQKMLTQCNVTCNDNVAQCNATDIDKELDIDKEDIKDNIVHQNAQREPKKPNKKEISEEVRQKTESLWKLYPLKKGKSTAVKKIPKLLKKYTFEQLKTCIERYTQDVEHRRKTGFKELKFQNGSTFFNGTFEDYLDENWKEGCNGQNNDSTATTENTPTKETEGDRLFRLAKEKYGDTAFRLDDNEYDF
jgi:predicted phage replisome organizer